MPANNNKTLKDNRIKQILNLLNQHGEVQINNLCRLFGVTEITIRRDLDDLAVKKLLIRTHGGAVLADEDILVEMPFEKRYVTNSVTKESIAGEAFKLISSGMKIALDSGSTTFFLARMIPNSLRLAVITNSLNIATELNSRINVDVTLIGGDLRKNTLACTGDFSSEMIRKYWVDIAFLGASGIGENGLLYTSNTDQAKVKASMIGISQKSVLMADSSKFQKPDYVNFAAFEDFDYVITDSKVPKSMVDTLHEKEVGVIIAD